MHRYQSRLRDRLDNLVSSLEKGMAYFPNLTLIPKPPCQQVSLFHTQIAPRALDMHFGNIGLWELNARLTQLAREWRNDETLFMSQPDRSYFFSESSALYGRQPTIPNENRQRVLDVIGLHGHSRPMPAM